ncbi:hypothetical protein QMK19_03715 [Streptomyces sp. H10-C2]|uniref:hypothetical protein n=1 Tax=unclassified Streptomyces TaxID=2593676 RepID=UPI0024BA271E|nr:MULTISPECIES: hypothetical protein [unclassified Streptomyces]MDJ0342295.1 hypothetical protein [Streptomyces sp. PH10-H1]MDJ0368809.1 hypothetical protein [Streptomyces sp. H10-C2]
MLWAAESIYEGTWASGPAPIEVQWVELMREYGWSWQEYAETPEYPKRVAWDLMVARRDAENSRNQQQNQPQGR